MNEKTPGQLLFEHDTEPKDWHRWSKLSVKLKKCYENLAKRQRQLDEAKA